MHIPDHEKLFDEICDKLQELSQSSQESVLAERLEKMQTQLRKSHEDLMLAHQEIEERIKSFDSLNFVNSDLNKEIEGLYEQLEQERINNSKLSTDLAKYLELNLRLQYEAKSQSQDLEMSQSLCQEYDEHMQKQHAMIKNLSEAAEKKMIELKMALDKKTAEGKDYYNHLQQAMTQIHVLRQENSALKEYIHKMTALSPSPSTTRDARTS